MAKTRKGSWNPLSFLPVQVTIIGSLSYAVLLAALLWQHVTVPPAPSTAVPVAGINLTSAWLDLEFISDGYHPWGSKRNDAVREYLLQRIEEILKSNHVDHKTVYASPNNTFISDTVGVQSVTVFANDTSNFTGPDSWTQKPWTLYGESENILVYIRGTDDKEGDWWNTTDRYDGNSGVLVSAHYDSVATGFGTTDDGVGVVSILQLISYYTRKGNQPRRGLVALLNNGEENGLYGAYNYLEHPLSQLTHTFLNLEGAGAGGRATLFRSTDMEVTKAYAKSPRPFGSIVSGDGFKRGAIKSGTDYSVFNSIGGMRGLDVAFFEPRSRYHTDQDSKANTSPASLWHMLSAALATTKELTSFKGDEFEGSTNEHGKLDIGKGSDGIWFDLFGMVFALGKLNTLFAFSVALLTAGPILFILLEVLLRYSDKWYVFAGKRYLRSTDDDEAVRIHGRRGFFRFPIAFIISTAVVVALAYLVTKINPYIIYSSEYSVWAMSLSVWFAVSWFFSNLAANTRPTALHRMYVLIWMYAISWVLLVFATIGEKNLHLGSGYFLVIYQASISVALLISYLELLALPKISKYVEHVLGAQDDAASIRPSSRASRPVTRQEEPEANERTSLLHHSPSGASQSTFARIGRRRAADRNDIPEDTEDSYLNQAYLDEQAWSSSLPQWTWILQFLVLCPINVIIVGQIALLLTSALYQTPADGNSVFNIYIAIATLTVLLLLPLSPFLHRFSYHIPTFLFMVFVGCLIYNLIAFPFSRENRLKYYFVQQMDLNSGVNNVTVIGIDEYIQDIVREMPSAAGQKLHCGGHHTPSRPGLTGCSWHGLPPNVAPLHYPGMPSNATLRHSYKHWVDFNSTHDGNTASLSLRGLNTKICKLVFDNPVSHVVIENTHPSSHGTAASFESAEVHLFSRTWDQTFRVNVTWADGKAKKQTGRAVCQWAEVNQPGTIPAFDELKRFEPFWAVATKNGDGLLEGWKEFEI
ncbi:unnamed protein product [Zymoseptoria tritici ST99CH_3D1]|nr:unnamed protein product [Zymoseptoria tritici ST99CH_3D1]